MLPSSADLYILTLKSAVGAVLAVSISRELVTPDRTTIQGVTSVPAIGVPVPPNVNIGAAPPPGPPEGVCQLIAPAPFDVNT